MIHIIAINAGFLVVGFIGGFLFRSLFGRLSEYAGVIKIIKTEDKLIYSIELNDDDYLEDLQYREEVVFKVETSEELSGRE